MKLFLYFCLFSSTSFPHLSGFHSFFTSISPTFHFLLHLIWFPIFSSYSFSFSFSLVLTFTYLCLPLLFPSLTPSYISVYPPFVSHLLCLLLSLHSLHCIYLYLSLPILIYPPFLLFSCLLSPYTTSVHALSLASVLVLTMLSPSKGRILIKCASGNYWWVGVLPDDGWVNIPGSALFELCL